MSAHFKLGKWEITYCPKPIPDRRYDWDAVHEDYDGEEDERYFTGESLEDLKAQIKEYEDE